MPEWAVMLLIAVVFAAAVAAVISLALIWSKYIAKFENFELEEFYKQPVKDLMKLYFSVNKDNVNLYENLRGRGGKLLPMPRNSLE
jgi:hypothetical protein